MQSTKSAAQMTLNTFIKTTPNLIPMISSNVQRASMSTHTMLMTLLRFPYICASSSSSCGLLKRWEQSGQTKNVCCFRLLAALIIPLPKPPTAVPTTPPIAAAPQSLSVVTCRFLLPHFGQQIFCFCGTLGTCVVEAPLNVAPQFSQNFASLLF